MNQQSSASSRRVKTSKNQPAHFLDVVLIENISCPPPPISLKMIFSRCVQLYRNYIRGLFLAFRRQQTDLASGRGAGREQA